MRGAPHGAPPGQRARQHLVRVWGRSRLGATSGRPALAWSGSVTSDCARSAAVHMRQAPDLTVAHDLSAGAACPNRTDTKQASGRRRAACKPEATPGTAACSGLHAWGLHFAAQPLQQQAQSLCLAWLASCQRLHTALRWARCLLWLQGCRTSPGRATPWHGVVGRSGVAAPWSACLCGHARGVGSCGSGRLARQTAPARREGQSRPCCSAGAILDRRSSQEAVQHLAGVLPSLCRAPLHKQYRGWIALGVCRGLLRIALVLDIYTRELKREVRQRLCAKMDKYSE